MAVISVRSTHISEKQIKNINKIKFQNNKPPQQGGILCFGRHAPIVSTIYDIFDFYVTI